jgi:hypothetical protein
MSITLANNVEVIEYDAMPAITADEAEALGALVSEVQTYNGSKQ